ncbi:hypothetical protein [Acetilactobacillus jinshanensis]|uniref:Uncharacterized protein n=1 Tax=Acetilactobacillus jinshanensis TaxID=1720083 RepID=A0A4P6ZKR2_9LACO|nr:hypothetical protein [Acetilactobacillus jinshanensis]QBP18153.1 hypothetical protein ELX58_03150 [Acetilactobacillus jinshanensis]URL61019.1 hypothetical protein HGK75_03205 [uncultured bacterium]
MKIHKLVSSALLSVMLLSAGATAIPANASSTNVQKNQPVTVVKQAKLSKNQAKKQKQTKILKNVKKAVKKDHHRNWFKDGLSKRQLRARAWIVRHESGGHWNILSYGHVCVGYFQLNPAYLGYKHGHVNLNHKHQVQVADHYVKARYGSWVRAQHFWQAHHWY